MKKKIGLGILALLAIVFVYGTVQLMPLLKLLKEIDLSDFAPPVIEEENVDNVVAKDTESVKNVDKLPNNNDDKDNDDNKEISLSSGINAESNQGLDNGKTSTSKTNQNSNVEKARNEKDNTQADDKANTPSKDSNNKSNSISNKDEKSIVLSSDKIESVEKEISLADKAKAVKLIISNLSASDIKTLKDLASGGLTPEEKTKAIQIAYSKYNTEELKLIKELYNKYIGK